MTASPSAFRLRFDWWLVALLSSALILFLVADRTAARIDNLIYDNLLRIGERPPAADILLVTIDNRSLREIGPWPWPRERHAALLQAIAKARPRAIIDDILFTEPGPPDADHRLGEAMAQAGAPVFVPLLLSAPGTNGAAFDVIEPIEPVRKAAAGIGHANLTFDADGLVRRIALSTGDEKRRWPHVIALAYQQLRGATDPTLPPAQRSAMIAYAGPPGHFPAISAASVLRGEVPSQFLHNRLILIGATGDGLGDQYPTPLAGPSGVMPGVEILANLFDSMLTDRLIRPVEGVALYIAALLPLWGLLFAFRRLSPRRTILLLFALLAVIFAATAGLMLFGIWLPPAAAMIGLAIVYPLWGWRRLAAVSAYMVSELEQLRDEPELLPFDKTPLTATDIVGRQTQLLGDAIKRTRDLRHFVSDRLHQMPDAMLVTDCDGQIMLANQEAQKLLASLTGNNGTGENITALLGHFQPTDATMPVSVFPPPQAETATEVTTADGRFFDLRYALQHASDGQPVGWIARIVDISDAKAALRRQEDVRQLLTHDMRSPQASIIAVIDHSSADQIDQEIGRRIKGYAQRTLALADSFVQLARAESHQYALEDVDLADVLIDAVDDLWPQSSARGMPVILEGERHDLFLSGERSLLTRAFINLVGNAIKYSPDGGTIRCHLSRRETAAGGIAVCAISDEGIGIAPEQLATLFEPFRRVSGGRAARIEGVGLGLAFVRAVIARHGGNVSGASRLGEGSTFTVELPLID
ncbi:CHASE2 domain-containing protein [Sphingomonas sp. KC8]|uniref:CHASE2 domain-containing protein n=1 Tax=Sphingomonas sp. KC8 TaxID=1030157 RepID=UPI000248AB2C|nr:CHASE2 domain-containing protein [Sphingomonas sp. KC8]ARS28798.1 signal transduction histidine kinase [Sphingomonas sp. KC8]